MRLARVNDPHHASNMLHKARQVKHESVQVSAERLSPLENDAFTEVDNAFVESQLVEFFIDWIYHDFLHMKVMTESPKTFQAAEQSTLLEQKCKRDFT